MIDTQPQINHASKAKQDDLGMVDYEMTLVRNDLFGYVNF